MPQTLSYTTLAAAIPTSGSGTNGDSILLTAAPPFLPTLQNPLILYVGGEAIQVFAMNALNSRQAVTFVRGAYGTKSVVHSNGAFVVMGSMQQFSTDFINGSILSTGLPPLSLPHFDVLTGNAWYLSGGSAGEWQFAPTFAAQSPSFGITAIADAAYTALFTDMIIEYTSLTAARAVTLPAANLVPRGKTLIVKDASGAAGASNITVTGTIDGSANKVINTNYGIVRVYSDGSAWYTW